ncbi:28S ribosomal protein S29 mitochondrial [Bienertia sinuspersici]
MWRRFISDAVKTKRHHHHYINLTPIAAAISTDTSTFRRLYSAKPSISTLAKAKKKFKGDGKNDDTPGGSSVELDADVEGDKLRLKLLAEDEQDKSLDVGPNGLPLFTSDTCSYMKFRIEDLNAILPEGLPGGMLKEFEDTKRCALLIRQNFLDLRDNFRCIVDPPTWPSSAKAPKAKKQIVLDGPRSSGKSIALAMLAHWACDEGWQVFYAPKGLDWTHGGFFYKNPQTGLWDTPIQAENILKNFLKFNEIVLQKFPCQISDPIPLREDAGVGFMKGADSLAMPKGSTLFDLIQTGVTHTHAAVGVLVRLRKELSLVKDVPMLLAIDQYNNWYTFSAYEEVVTPRSSRPIHARELAAVNAFRPMTTHDDMMVGALSHSTSVGKLRKDLPNVPHNAHIDFPRYNVDEAAAVCHYYLRQRLIRREAFTGKNGRRYIILQMEMDHR